MNPIFNLGIGFAAAFSLASTLGATDLDKLRVLYLGDIGTPRAQQFTGFLAKNVGRVEAVSRKEFKPADAAQFDVVLLDWPQSQSTREEWKARSPLGDRGRWAKPTVLLGSAGLNLAVVWKVRGGSG
jgi:hypothetical protein